MSVNWNYLSNYIIFLFQQECAFCRKPLLFDHFEARTREPCMEAKCPQFVAVN